MIIISLNILRSRYVIIFFFFKDLQLFNETFFLLIIHKTYFNVHKRLRRLLGNVFLIIVNFLFYLRTIFQFDINEKYERNIFNKYVRIIFIEHIIHITVYNIV